MDPKGYYLYWTYQSKVRKPLCAMALDSCLSTEVRQPPGCTEVEAWMMGSTEWPGRMAPGAPLWVGAVCSGKEDVVTPTCGYPNVPSLASLGERERQAKALLLKADALPVAVG